MHSGTPISSLVAHPPVENPVYRWSAISALVAQMAKVKATRGTHIRIYNEYRENNQERGFQAG